MRKRRLVPFLVVLAMVSVVELAAQEDAVPSSQADLDAVLATYLEVWNTGELERLDDIVNDDFARHAGPSESPSSRQGLKELIRESRRLYRRLTFEVDDLFTIGDRGAMRGTFRGGYKDTDRAVHFPVMSHYRFENGRLAEEWILANNLSTLIALSFTVAPPGYTILPPDANGEVQESRVTPVVEQPIDGQP